MSLRDRFSSSIDCFIEEDFPNFMNESVEFLNKINSKYVSIHPEIRKLSYAVGLSAIFMFYISGGCEVENKHLIDYKHESEKQLTYKN
ncbi:hypothetical protein CMO90_02475 [Candidatus Woesearchaeota archaeon]|jgi:hypothetical protein|nr:hypothetical protein [Candidatus Woesearchaeota archaeon]|tara:strand:+ start:528 stop:791 length:264 start_codon:yes stop_codon:yes gene_type:complete